MAKSGQTSYAFLKGAESSGMDDADSDFSDDDLDNALAHFGGGGAVVGVGGSGNEGEGVNTNAVPKPAIHNSGANPKPALRSQSNPQRPGRRTSFSELVEIQYDTAHVLRSIESDDMGSESDEFQRQSFVSQLTAASLGDSIVDDGVNEDDRDELANHENNSESEYNYGHSSTNEDEKSEVSYEASTVASNHTGGSTVNSNQSSSEIMNNMHNSTTSMSELSIQESSEHISDLPFEKKINSRQMRAQRTSITPSRNAINPSRSSIATSRPATRKSMHSRRRESGSRSGSMRGSFGSSTTSSMDSSNKGKMKRGKSGVSYSFQADGVYHTHEKLNDGGLSLLRRLVTRGTSVTEGNLEGKRRGSGDSGLVQDSHETLEFIAKNADDAHFSMDTAAAQLVAAGMSGSKYQYRFGTNEYVLCSLDVMNKSAFPEMVSRNSKLRNALNGNEIPDENLEPEVLKKKKELEEKITTEPVNRFGFPAGQGSKVEEQRGPYLYVLAKVKMVHFEEDARYYTVTRCDTNLDQRADSEWMLQEPITSEKGLEAALLAAKQNAVEKAKQLANRSKSLQSAINESRLQRFLKNCITGPVTKLRSVAKHHISLLLLGLPPYSFEFRCSGVNILFCCSFLFVFLDQIRLSFAPPEWDRQIVILNTVIWAILVVELVFETLIRPEGYQAILRGEKKYNPSTARYLDNFHLISETLALILFIPEMVCLIMPGEDSCGKALSFTLLEASLQKTYGPTRSHVAMGTLFFGFLRLRIFGLVRHFKQVFFTRHIIGLESVKKERRKFSKAHGEPDITETLLEERERLLEADAKKKAKNEHVSAIISTDKKEQQKEKGGPTAEEDRRLNDAANIGTALAVINSHRVMILLIITVGILPFVSLFQVNAGTNRSMHNLVKNLQFVNKALPNTSDCDHLEQSIDSWIAALYQGEEKPTILEASSEYHPVLWAQLLPIRCDFQVESDGVITCGDESNQIWNLIPKTCQRWKQLGANTTLSHIAETSKVRVGSVRKETDAENNFRVLAYTNSQYRVFVINFRSIMLQLLIVFELVIALVVLRNDALRLVLEPLRRMIKIVIHYAKNPLAPAPKWTKKKKSKKTSDDDEDELGNFETEQLITAVTKITDLLRKCWGVAGAGIISSNLARTQSGKTVVFNPLVPGKLVYALFGFCGIMDFAYLLHALDHSVIELINDVAKVVHDEIYRWGLAGSGQCNKNLGGAFLMVYRIGDFKEVHEKKNRATNVIFDQKKQANPTDEKSRRGKTKGIQRKKLVDSHQLPFETVELASLPGISAFTDRALVGMLKSFAGIHRDRNLLKWSTDDRLVKDGVESFSVNMIFGIDAGWGVEGAVGSEHKIDATYLSPHVNMASRMMSATKQFGVHILLSQAATELLSSVAKSKVRHLDTVSVKGSSVEQRIYTYDARHTGVDFFLMGKSDRVASLESDRFTPSSWETDRDLLAMRQHVSRDFLNEFNYGRDFYLAGDWEKAIKSLKKANNIMISTMIDEGVVEYEVLNLERRLLDENDVDEQVQTLRKELGDGPSMCLISFMENRGGVAPKNWDGYRPLTSK